MANWLEKLQARREARVNTGRPLSDAERDRYKTAWANALRVIGVVVAKITGRREAAKVAEKTGERYGQHVAKELDRRVAERNKRKSPPG